MIFDSQFFDSSEFDAGVIAETTHGKGDNKGKRRRQIFKPTGLIDRAVEASIEKTVEIAEEVRAEVRQQFVDMPHADLKRQSLSEVDAEIALLMKKMMADDDDLILVVLLAATVQ